MTKRASAVVVLLSVVGLLAAASSTYVHLQLVANPSYTSFCDINESVSCSQVYQSPYGSVRGIPVALGGVLWFGTVLLLVLADARGPRESRENIASYLLVWSTLGLSVTMYLAYASFVVLQTFCLLCGVVYVAVVGIFLLTGAGPSTPLRQLPGAMARDLAQLVQRPVGLMVTLAFVAVSLAAAVLFPEPQPLSALASSSETEAAPPPTADQASEFERFWNDQPRVDAALSSELGSGSADVVVVKFNDYQCPACAQTHLAYDPIFAKYESSHPGRVHLLLRDFPLDPACNDDAPNGPHDAACEAAVAARLAREVGEEPARRMDEWLYANQAQMEAEAIKVALADIAGVDEAVFDERYDQVVAAVQADIALGAALPVEATPTFIVNGVILKGGLAPQFFDQAIALELERAGGGP